ncbi:hypothetical protein GR925_27385 [Streptomyces sp. HUCO-GS316]|uniref:hypothetical protein n=1 Tax=Streptomyces sp. HUCO-GS316 TaxID=2692198 RepID=UPI001370D5E0|nr:hypothetical protein [Streptomyces sp. HUCO-GS316]MXM67052.1 hypothetical protein [Streptomyces sp. HUCO-GS316]
MSDVRHPARCLTASWLSDSGPALDCGEVLTAEGIELLIYGPDGELCDTSFLPLELLDDTDRARVAAAAGSAGPVVSAHAAPPMAPPPRTQAGMDRIPLPRVPGRPVRA